MAVTTPSAFSRWAEADATFFDAFEVVRLATPTAEESAALVREQLGEYEKHHRVRVTDDALRAAVEQVLLPEQALRLLDRAGAVLQVRAVGRPRDSARFDLRIREIETELESLQLQKEKAVASSDFDSAVRLRDHADKLKQEWSQAQHERNAAAATEVVGVVDADAVREVLRTIAGGPAAF